jgi:hypothetical protein
MYGSQRRRRHAFVTQVKNGDVLHAVMGIPGNRTLEPSLRQANDHKHVLVVSRSGSSINTMNSQKPIWPRIVTVLVLKVLWNLNTS